MKAMSLRIRMATHWPGATPSAANPAAMRRTRLVEIGWVDAAAAADDARR